MVSHGYAHPQSVFEAAHQIILFQSIGTPWSCCTCVYMYVSMRACINVYTYQYITVGKGDIAENLLNLHFGSMFVY